jgi:hypothetical protein
MTEYGLRMRVDLATFLDDADGVKALEGPAIARADWEVGELAEREARKPIY